MITISISLLEVAVACAVVGTTMVLAGLIYWVKTTYPPSEKGECR